MIVHNFFLSLCSNAHLRGQHKATEVQLISLVSIGEFSDQTAYKLKCNFKTLFLHKIRLRITLDSGLQQCLGGSDGKSVIFYIIL